MSSTYSLPVEEYPRLLPLFSELRFNLAVDSILAGNTPARVFTTPQLEAALLWNRQDALLVGGEPGHAAASSLGELIDAHILPDARSRRIPELVLQVSPGWEKHLKTLLSTVTFERAQRRYYAFFDRPLVQWRTEIPQDYQLIPLDSNLLEGNQLKNQPEMGGWVRSFWRPENFVQTGFGFCLRTTSAILSWCFTVYVSGNNYELAVATAPEARNRGFATLTAARCLDYGQTRGAIPHWHCSEDNLPSQAVAEKVGFSNPVTYLSYRFHL